MPAPASKPTILLVPGGWHPPNSYSNVTSRLSSLSYPINAIQNPSLNSPSKGLTDDISHVRSALQTLIDVEGKDVIVISHSYGGLPAVVSVTGYGKSERNAAGKKGGVLGMLFMATSILPAGISQVNAKGRENWLYWPGKEENKVPTPTDAHNLFYNDLSPEAARPYIEKLEPQGFLAFDQDVPPYDLSDIPSIYLACANDNALLPAVQERVVKLLGKYCTTEWCDASHSPFLSKEDLVIELVERLAREET